MSYRCLQNLRPGRAPIWLLVAGLAACGWFTGAPESRARDYVRGIIAEPENTDRLTALTHPRAGMDDVLDTLSGRVAVDYLRAKHRQGQSLKFGIGNLEKLGDGRRVHITVVDYAEAKHGIYDKVVFVVYLENSERGWLVTRVQTAE